MASIAPHQDAMVMAVEDALRKRVFDALKSPLMKIAEKEVDKAVNDAIDQININLEGYRDNQYMRDVINVLVRRTNG